MEDREHPFETFVLETLTRRSAELGRRWAERTQLAVPDPGRPHSDVERSDVERSDVERSDAGSAGSSASAAQQLVCALLAATADGAPHRHEPLVRIGLAVGVEAHRQSASLHVMLEKLDLLGMTLLRAAERAAAEFTGQGATARAGLVLARRITGVTSLLRLAATKGYAQAVEDELRERYRTIRHDLRNPLGTIKSAIALLTDESVPAEMRESQRVRAMVARNATSLDRMINEALGDAAAQLPAFVAPEESRDGPVDTRATGVPSDLAAGPTAPPAADSGRQQRDDVSRARQRTDLESGAL